MYIAVIDDEEDIRELVTIHVAKAGFDIAGFADGASFLASLKRRKPDLIVLDLMLPDIDGRDICKQLKSSPETVSLPVIMLTAKGQEADRVAGLELGADDYVTKPFSPRELLARIKAVLRRAGHALDLLTIKDILTIDPERFEVKVDGETIILTAVEFKILYLLATHRGKVFNRERILDHLWGNEKAVLDRTVDVHIRNLREKLGAAGALVQNVRGVGYKVEA